VPWYVVGGIFGSLCWAGMAVPVLLSLGLRLGLPNRLVVVQSVEWLATCVAIGSLCALSWQRVV
jgi:hypothetical protein